MREPHVKRHKIKSVALLAGTLLTTSDALLQSLRRHALAGSDLRHSGFMNAALRPLTICPHLRLTLLKETLINAAMRPFAA